ncbi:MAG TPA: nucleoside triphosphate pyrophosphohydrolase [Steroidobacteraceae bacterium]|jgi:MazG family protein|nr:nucleoside triphosphate pyrophosphohydrolase [Steroidobacteraceae bacterium]
MSEIDRLLAIMSRLRAPDGCPWDREQTFASIAPYTIEEAYEVADAIERGDPGEIKDELGDLLFQVVFHAEIGREAGRFEFDGVAGAICDKLVRRHPHVFAEPLALTPAGQTLRWEDIKARERQAKGRGSALGESRPVGHLDGIPRALPALMRAYKISKRAARVGFDFEHPSQTADKVQEELDEVRAEAAEERLDARRIFEEIGDLLFAAANLARKLDVDAEAALRAANDKFERRFRAMEALAAGRGDTFADLGLEAQERLWQEVKRGE